MAMRQLGSILEGARVRQALSQGALAGLLQVSQQTVSRWEQGVSRPRPRLLAKLAEVLNLEPAELTGAAGATASLVAMERPIGVPEDDTAPMRPLTPILPFQRLTADEFERAVADLMQRRFPDAKVSQLGGQGDDQRGFDILITQSDGQRIAVQCKREQQFGPNKVKQAVEAAELDVDESYIALARVATAAARFEMDRHAGWQLWDVADMSRLIRTFDAEAALQVVRTYFPDHVEAFLGFGPSTPWRTAEEFYRGSAQDLLHHRQALVGRAQLVDEVVAWANDPEGTEIATVIGRGGLGKSKLLWEVARRAEQADVRVRFLATAQQPLVDDFDLLPRTGPLVLVLDDAHNVDRVAGIISQLWQSRPGAKVLLATRPYGQVELDAEIWRLNQAPRTTTRWGLDDLTDGEAVQLVSGLTSRSPRDPFTRQLAAVSRDCPFIAVVAADLYRRGELEGTTFASDAALRRDVLGRFSEKLTGPSGGSDTADRRSVLAALAIFQPVRLDDPNFETALCELTDVDSWDLVNGRIRELEDAGFVLRRSGTAVRVIPDMFADVLVANAAYDDRSGQSTSFLARAQRAADGAPLQHLLVNASRIDWQVRDGGDGRAGIVENLWSALREQLLGGTSDQRVTLLALIARIAFFQPDLAFRLVEEVLVAGDDGGPRLDPIARPWMASHAHVVNATIPVLRNIAYHLQFLRPALDRLWALAQDDRRPTNQFPEHPLRVLRSIADLSTGKPLTYLDVVIAAAADWLMAPSRVSPFEVLEPILAVEGSDEISSDLTLTFYSFGIDPAVVRPVRQRVVDLAFKTAESSDVRAAVRAIKSLETAIQQPIGQMNRKVAAEELNSWTIEFLPIIERLGVLGADPARDPAIRLGIREALAWHADHSGTATKEAARAALDGLPASLEDKLALCLHAGWGRLAMRTGLTYEEAEHTQREKFGRVGAAISEGRSDEEILEGLEHRLEIERRAFERIDGAGIFLADLLAGRPSLATLLLRKALAGEWPELAAFSATAIGVLADVSDAGAVAFASAMLSTANAELQRAAATGLSWNRGGRVGLLPGESTVLAAMAVHDNADVRAMAGRAVFFIGLSDITAALDLLTKIKLDDSPNAASEALGAFTHHGPISWSDTTPAQRRHLLRQLVELDSIDAYEIMAALSELTLIDPLGVTNLLMQRVDLQAVRKSLDYRALPYAWDPAPRVNETTELSTCLTTVRDWFVGSYTATGYHLQDDGAALYRLVAGGWNEQALTTLTDFGDTPSEADVVTAGRILAEAPPAVLFAHVPLISQLFVRAKPLGKDTTERVLEALLTTSGVVIWRGDESSADDRHDVEQARQIIDSLPHGSVERRFFDLLAERIEVRLNWAGDRGRPQYDGREW